MKVIQNVLSERKNNFIFVGEAGSGKSEIALNFAYALAKDGRKQVHFFDMDMTKPLFRSRSVADQMQKAGIEVHYEEQFMDAPTLVGGVLRLLRDNNCFVVMDIGGDHIGARAIGGFAAQINSDQSKVYYVLNAFRPWSVDIDHIDKTLVDIMGVSNIRFENIAMINNANLGPETSVDDFILGSEKMSEMITPYKEIEFTCVNQHLFEQVKGKIATEVMPLNLYLTQEWM